jgi:hypothetical protein
MFVRQRFLKILCRQYRNIPIARVIWPLTFWPKNELGSSTTYHQPTREIHCYNQMKGFMILNGHHMVYRPINIHLYLFFDWLITYCFPSHSRIFHLWGDVSITGEGLQNLGLHVFSTLRAFEQGGIFNVPHLLWHGDSVFPVSSYPLEPWFEKVPHIPLWVARGDWMGTRENSG